MRLIADTALTAETRLSALSRSIAFASAKGSQGSAEREACLSKSMIGNA